MSTPLNPMSFMQPRQAENTAPHNAVPSRLEVGPTSGQASSSSSSGTFITLFLSRRLRRVSFRYLCLHPHPATNGILGNSSRRVPALALELAGIGMRVH